MICFNPEADLNAIWSALKSDATILSALGLSGATSLDIAKRIIKRSVWDDLTDGERRMAVYFRPSRRVRNEIVAELVLQVDCHVPAKEDYLAYRIQTQAKKVLHGSTVNGRTLHFDGLLGELPSMPGFVCVGSRYRLYSTL